MIALQLLDGLQGLIRSLKRDGRWRPLPSSALASAPQDQAGELMKLLQIWGLWLLGRVIPNLEPELQQLLAHTLQRSLEVTAFPAALQQLKPPWWWMVFWIFLRAPPKSCFAKTSRALIYWPAQRETFAASYAKRSAVRTPSRSCCANCSSN